MVNIEKVNSQFYEGGLGGGRLQFSLCFIRKTTISLIILFIDNLSYISLFHA